MTTPLGSPPWTRSTDITQYGGHQYKANYQSQGVVNPRTDIGAEGFARLTADLAAIVRVTPFATIGFRCDDVTPGPPTITFALMQTGVAVASYVGNDPPSGYPSAVRNGTGDVTFTFASSYVDDYGVSAAFAISNVIANPLSALGILILPEWTVGSLTVRLRGMTPSGTPVISAAGSFMVW